MTWRPLLSVTSTSLFLIVSLSDSLAQSDSRSLIKSNMLSQYAIIKNLIDPRRTGVHLTGREPQNLGTCGDMESLYFGIHSQEDVTTTALVRIAGHYYKWEHELPLLGYSLGIVSPLIDEVERRLLAHVVAKGGDNFQNKLRPEAGQLAKQLNAVKSRQNLRAKTVYFTDECGGGGRAFAFKIPKQAHLFLISEFFIELCKKQGFDPYDRRKCNHWSEIPEGADWEMAGTYTYTAEWEDGTTRTARINFDKMLGREFRVSK